MSEAREQLIAVVLSASWPDGGHEALPTKMTAPFVAEAILASDWYADHTYQLRRCNRIRQEQAAEIVSLRAELAAARRAP